MADGETSKQSTSKENDPKKDDYDPKFDFFSDKFDPLLALQHPGLIAPVSSAKRYDNLAAFEVAMDKEKNPEKYAKKRENVVKTGVSVERKWLPHQLPVATQKKLRSTRNVFSKMEKAQGPLALLYKCVQEKIKIKVYTRNEEKTRGYCLAYVVAFDKHFNMALEDVTEVWTRRRKKKVPALDSAESVQKFKFPNQFKIPEITIRPHPSKKKLEICTRQVDQFMIRGEHVVLVSAYQETEKIKEGTQEEVRKEENESKKQEAGGSKQVELKSGYIIKSKR